MFSSPGPYDAGVSTSAKSVGVAVQDAVAAQLTYDAAVLRGIGAQLNL